jgi:hypothetical protein
VFPEPFAPRLSRAAFATLGDPPARWLAFLPMTVSAPRAAIAAKGRAATSGASLPLRVTAPRGAAVTRSPKNLHPAVDFVPSRSSSQQMATTKATMLMEKRARADRRTRLALVWVELLRTARTAFVENLQIGLVAALAVTVAVLAMAVLRRA